MYCLFYSLTFVPKSFSTQSVQKHPLRASCGFCTQHAPGISEAWPAGFGLRQAGDRGLPSGCVRWDQTCRLKAQEREPEAFSRGLFTSADSRPPPSIFPTWSLGRLGPGPASVPGSHYTTSLGCRGGRRARQNHQVSKLFPRIKDKERPSNDSQHVWQGL